MAEQIFPEWRKSHEATRYPFADNATLVNANGFLLLEGTFLDASLYPIGGADGLYLSNVTLDHQVVTLTLSDRLNLAIASASFPLFNPPNLISFTDVYGRPAGVLVSESARLGIFQSWDVGSHDFTVAQTGFAATVCVPTPELGVRGILLDDGTLLTGDVYLVGEDGIVVREVIEDVAQGCVVRPQRVVRVDVVGDPLFRRRLCVPHDLFGTPKFITNVRVLWSEGEFECVPDRRGDLKVTVNNAEAVDTVLRIRPTPAGLLIEAVGDPAN